jgi:hypothetical protein
VTVLDWPDGLQRPGRDPGLVTGWRAAWLWAILSVVALRVGLGLTMGIAWLSVKPYLPPDLLSDSTFYGGLPTFSFPADSLLGVWQRWDAVHHLNLARLGYSGLSVGDSVFYPLYALLTRWVTWALRSEYVVGGLVISTLSAIAMFACLYRLAADVYGGSSARWTILALTVYPTAFFFVAPFTESLFLALTLGCFLAAYRRRWWLCGGLGILASLARGPGLLTPVALVWIAWGQWRARKLRLTSGFIVSVAAGLSLPVLGGLAFEYWRAAQGFPPMQDVLLRYSNLEMTNPIRGLVLALVQLASRPGFSPGLDVSSAGLFLGLTAAMVLRRRWRQVDWLIYMIVNLVVFLSKHSVTASSLQSLARYVLVLFPGFIVIGDHLAHSGPRTRFVYMASSSALLIVLSILYAVWWFIG